MKPDVLSHGWTWLAWICLAFISPYSAWSAVIGLDGRHGNSGSGGGNLVTSTGMDTFRATITGAGHSIVPVVTFDSASLVGLDALFLTQPTDPDATQFSASEISSIQAFVSAGHGLLVFGEGGFSRDSTVNNLNMLVAPYGVTYSTSVSGGNGETITGFVPHPITMSVSTVGMDFYRPLFAMNPALDLTTGMVDILAVVNASGGAGNVVLISDTSLWSDDGEGSDRPIGFGDNRLLLQNTISFVTVPEPSTMVLLAVLLFGSWVVCRPAKLRSPRGRED